MRRAIAGENDPGPLRVHTKEPKSNEANGVSSRGVLDGTTAADRSPSAGSVDFWRMAHTALRGRYRLAIAIAVGGAIAGAFVGGASGRRLYSATGLVRIASDLPPVMRETDQNRSMAMFDGFIQAQREVMLSREVIHAATQEELWQQLSEDRRTPSDAQFASSLKVETQPRSDHLRVVFVHKDPIVAAAAVQSVIGAYRRAFTHEQQLAEGSRMDLLQRRRARLSTELETRETAINAALQGATLADLEPLYIEASERFRKLKSALTDVQIALAGGPDVAPKQGESARSPSEIVDDEILRAYTAEQARLELQLLD